MKPIEFKQQTQILAEDQPEYINLPVHQDDSGIVTYCYKLTLWERLIILITGKMWHRVMTFGNKLQPQSSSVGCPLKGAE